MKTDKKWQEVKGIVYSALELDPEQREKFLDEKCHNDSSLRREVESLLAAHKNAEDHFESPAAELMAETLIAEGNGYLQGKYLGSYQIIEKIGSGGMGDVYLARDSRLDRKVALKVLPEILTADEQAKQRFIQEAKAASALNHPNIITIYEIGTDDARDFIAMEYVEGETIRDQLSRGRIETRRAVEFAAQAASGLAAAHEAGIVHRDVKPENLMVTRGAQIKILDFGLAKLVEQQRVSLTDSNAPTVDLAHKGGHVVTVPGTIMGTVAYMSPEQAEGRTLDSRSDIFSLGVVFYEMVGGKRPFEGRSAIDTLHSIINTDPPPVRELNTNLPLEVEDLLAKSLAKEPTERYQHAGDFELDLRRFKRALESGSLMSARMLEAIPEHRNSSSRYWWLAAAVLLVAALTATGLWFRFRPTTIPAAAAESNLTNATLAPMTVDPGFEGEPSFAPDGQTLAYVSDRTGNFEIFLRQISGGPDLNLTNNASDDMQPSISPDGKQIAFVSSRTGESDCLCFFIYGTDQPLMGGSIWVMPTFGGSPKKIADVGTFPSWSPDGADLLFTRGPWFGQGIFRVSHNGGDPQEVPVNLKEPAPFLAYPSLSPDGERILFEAGNKVFVAPAAGGDPEMIVAGKHPVWSASGESIIFTNVEAGKNYTLWQIPFSRSQGKADGAATPLTVGRGRDTQAAVSRDGRLIAFSALDVSFNLESMPFDAESAKVGTEPRPMTSGSDMIYFFSVTSDGSSAVFDSHRGSSSFIWKIDESKPSVQLTADPKFQDIYPQLSPDGKTVAFSRKPSSDPEAVEDTWLMEADGANPRLAIEKAALVSWMPDGREFVYISNVDGNLYLYSVGTKNIRQVTNEAGIAGPGIPSPDGKWLAYMSIAAGNIDLKAIPTAGGESITIVATPRQDFHPLFSPSGKWLYFQLDHKNLYRVPGPAQNWRQAAPEKVTNFAESGLFLEDPHISPDGRKLIYSRRRTSGDIWIMSLAK